MKSFYEIIHDSESYGNCVQMFQVPCKCVFFILKFDGKCV